MEEDYLTDDCAGCSPILFVAEGTLLEDVFDTSIKRNDMVNVEVKKVIISTSTVPEFLNITSDENQTLNPKTFASYSQFLKVNNKYVRST
jgi:hypothetical protein